MANKINVYKPFCFFFLTALELASTSSSVGTFKEPAPSTASSSQTLKEPVPSTSTSTTSDLDRPMPLTPESRSELKAQRKSIATWNDYHL